MYGRGGSTSQCLGESLHPHEEAVGQRDVRLRHPLVTQLQRVRDLDLVAAGAGVLLAAEVLHGDSDAKSVLAAIVPRGAIRGFAVGDDAAAEGPDGRGIVVKWPGIVLPSQDARIDGRVAQEVERHLGLGEQEVPQILGEVLGCSRQDGEEVGLEGAYGTLGCVASVHGSCGKVLQRLLIQRSHGMLIYTQTQAYLATAVRCDDSE